MKNFSLLLALFRFSGRLALILVFVWIVSFALPIVFGLALQSFFDSLGKGGASTSPAWHFLFGMLAVTISREIVRVFTFAQEAVLENHIGLLIRKHLFDHAFANGLASLRVNPASELLSRFRDDIGSVTTFMIWSPLFVGRFMAFIIATVIMLNISVLMSALMFLPYVVSTLVTRVLGVRVEKLREASLKKTGEVTELLGETFASILAIKTANAESSMLQKFEAIGDERKTAYVRDSTLSAVLGALWRNATVTSTGIVLLVAILFIGARNISIGSIALFVFYATWITDFMNMLGALFSRLRQVDVSLQRLKDLTDEHSVSVFTSSNVSEIMSTTRSDDSQDSQKYGDALASLRINDLAYRVGSFTLDMRGQQIELERGDVLVIAGQVGSGKTTLIKLILGLLPKSQGHVYWNTVQVSNLASHFVPPRCAYVPQTPRLLSGTLNDNLTLGGQFSQDELAQALFISALDQDYSPDDLNNQIGYKGVGLSGGQIQRFAIARAVIRKPQLLICDDLSSALDARTEEQVWNRIKGIQNLTQIVVSNRPSSLTYATKIAFLKRGVLESFGTPDHVLGNCDDARSLLV